MLEFFQDLIPDNNCFGCGPNNPHGLHIKSYWTAENESECRFMPSSHHSAGPLIYLNGGIIATLIDCHTVCTAIAKGYSLAGRKVGTGEKIWFATGGLEVTYKKPIRLDMEVALKAKIMEATPKKMKLICEVYSDGRMCVESSVVAVSVPSAWFA